MNNANPIKLDELQVGDELPGIEIPLTLQRLVMEAGSNRDFSLIHHDSEVARSTGAPDAFANTYFLMGMFERLMREWGGPAVQIRKIGPLRMSSFNTVGDTLAFEGCVESVDAASGAVQLNLWVESDRGRTVTCKASIEVGGS